MAEPFDLIVFYYNSIVEEFWMFKYFEKRLEFRYDF